MASVCMELDKIPARGSRRLCTLSVCRTFSGYRPQRPQQCDAVTVYFRAFKKIRLTMRLDGLWKTQIAPFFERHFWILCVCLVGIAGGRMISTYGALSLTVDEPAHLACGIEY